MNIYVGNLHFGINEEELKDIFEEYGEVTSAKVITDKYTGRSKGFGFVEMPNDTEAEMAIKSLHGTQMKGRNVTVNQSQERKDNFKKTDSRGPRSNSYHANY